MTHHNGYSEEWRGTGGPTISANRLRAIEANRDLLRSELLLATSKPRHPVRNACIAALMFGAVGFWAGRASADPLSISGTMVMLEPMEAPAVAVVTMQNVNVNGPTDNGVYALGMEGLALEVVFAWEVEEGGADSLLILPPDGMICLPADCLMVVEEGQAGRVVILEFVGS